MVKLNVKSIVITTTCTTLLIDDKQLVEVLEGVIKTLGHSIVDIQKIYIKVPGGGDWSNTQLDVDSTCPLVIELKKEKKE